MPAHRISRKAAQFTESVIREMTRLAAKHDAVNLAQGFPNFPAPAALKDAACRAVQADVNQYAITWGSARLRHAVADKYARQYGFEVDPEREITVACGATECMIASLLATVDPGERVLILEPFYENYGPDAIISGADPVFSRLRAGAGWAVDWEGIERSLRDTAKGRIKALILNSPHNPSGKVFTAGEMARFAELAREYDFYVLTDEIYEHIVYDGHRHHLIAALEGMRERTITISGLSKTFSVTGWRIGYILAPPDVSNAIRKMHDFLTVGAAAPLQEAAAEALRWDDAYYTKLAADYLERRDFLCPALEQLGFKTYLPSGAYYVMTDVSELTDEDDVAFVRHLIEHCGVAAVPGSSFYHRPEDGRRYVRFAFCKTREVLEEAVHRLGKLHRG